MADRRPARWRSAECPAPRRHARHRRSASPSAIRNGNRMLTHSMAITSCGHNRRGGSGRRSTIKSASEHNPAIAVRSAVSGDRIDRRDRDPRRRQRAAEDRHADKTQQQPETFARQCRRGHGGTDSESTHTNTALRRCAWRPCSDDRIHGRVAIRNLGCRCCSRPADAPDRNSRPSTTSREIPVAQRVIDPRAEPRAEHRAGEGAQREPV